jgi:hypothetical protein
LRGVDPKNGGYRVLDTDAELEAVQAAMTSGVAASAADDARRLKVLWAAFDDTRPEIQYCMTEADGAHPELQYQLQLTINGNSVATLIDNVSLERIDGVNPDHSPHLAKTQAEQCVKDLLTHLELPPGPSFASTMTIVRQDFCTPTIALAHEATDSFIGAYMRWWRAHPGQSCPASLEPLTPYGASLRHDPWDEPYVMRCDTTGFQVLSAGPDRKLGSADDIESHR